LFDNGGRVDAKRKLQSVAFRHDQAIYYAAVAGDILGTYLRWRSGKTDERQTAVTYSGQFFDLCARAGRRGVATFPSSERKSIIDPQFSIRSHPFGDFGKGVWFYVYQLCRAVWLFVDIIRSRASDVIVMDGVTFFFLLTPIAWSGRRVFLSIHTVPRRTSVDLNLLQRTIHRLDGWFIRRHCAGCLVASPTIASQISELAKCRYNSIALFYPTYDRKLFEGFVPSNPRACPFRIFYAGRIELEKGVFDLLQSFSQLRLAGRSLHLDYCGDGPVLPSLRDAIVSAGLSGHVKTHGHLTQSALLDVLERAQIVVVPTRSGFPEGLNQVVIEAVLARRPVVTSAVCPALELVSTAVVEAEADNAESYSAAIERLIDNHDLFQEKTSAAEGLREQFFDPERGWAAVAYKLVAGAG
jgi:glycogen(starch) synthase